MISTLHKNTSTGNYEPKASSLTIKIQTEKKLKSVGQVKIDLGKYADSEQDISEVLPLAKCPDWNARIGFKVRTKLIAEDVQDADTFS